MLTLHHDFPSAGSLVAVLRLQPLVDEGLAVRFRGLDVLGLARSLPATLEDLDDWRRHAPEAARFGWTLPRPRLHPPTLSAHLVAGVAAEHGLDAAWRLACYRAHWSEQADLGDREVLLGLAARVGLPAGPVAAAVDDHQARTRLRRRMIADRGQGIGGVPVLDVDGTFVSPDIPDTDLRMLAGL